LPLPETIADYLRELGDRILDSYPPLHAIDDPPSPMIGKLLRKPYPAQTLALMGLVRRWQQARAGAVIAECGTGKTLISLGAVQTHAEDLPFTALAMVPPQLVEKRCREAILTLPRVRVFIIDGLRTPTNSNSHHGVNEVKLRNKRIVREGLRTSLSELRLCRTSPSARKRWDSLCPSPALFVVGRDRAKLGYFWRHAYQLARCGRYQGSVVNPDSGSPVYLGEEGERLLAMDFKKVKLSETPGQGDGTNHARNPAETLCRGFIIQNQHPVIGSRAIVARCAEAVSGVVGIGRTFDFDELPVGGIIPTSGDRLREPTQSDRQLPSLSTG